MAKQETAYKVLRLQNGKWGLTQRTIFDTEEEMLAFLDAQGAKRNRDLMAEDEPLVIHGQGDYRKVIRPSDM